MNALLERRMEQFQSKVQQNINLADDEITRLASYLQTLKGDIVDVKDQLSRVAIKTAQLQQEATGKEKRYQASIETVVAKLKKEHHSVMKELQERHSQEIAAVYQAYQEEIAEIEKVTNQKIKQRTGPVEELLAQTQNQYKRMVEAQSTVDKTLELESMEDIRVIQELELERQRRLESAIEARNQERLESLLQAKSRLSDCVATLEEMDRNHASKMQSYMTRIETMDSRYQDQMKRETEKHNRVVEQLKRRQYDLDARSAALERTRSKIERNHKRQIEQAIQEGESLKLSIEAHEARSQQTAQESGKVQAWAAKLEQLKKKLESSENNLMQARTENEAMKREIARLKHEARMARRRPVLDDKVV